MNIDPNRFGAFGSISGGGIRDTGIFDPVAATPDVISGWDIPVGATVDANSLAELTSLAPIPKIDNGVLGTGMDGLQFAKTALGGLQTIGGLYTGLKQLGLAKKQFKFQKDAYNTNLNNQIQSYNTALADRARARAAFEGTGQAAADAYVEQNKMQR